MLRQIFFTRNNAIKKQNFVFRETEESLTDALEEAEHVGAMELPVDLVRVSNKLILKAPIVGAGIQDVNVTINTDQIIINKSGIQETDSNEQTYIQECHWGVLSRTVDLPKNIDPEQTKASLHEGVLTIVMPIATKSHIKTVKIQE